MKDDVEEFLKRVAQMRAEAQAKAQQAKPARPQQPPRTGGQQARPAQPAPPQVWPVQQPRPRPQPPPIEAEIVEPQIANRDDLIARGVQEHLRGAQEIAEHTRQLGAEVDLADDKLAAHLQQVFDHQLGDLKQSGAQQVASRERVTPDGLAPDAIVRLLRSPTAARDAVILAEILQRPEVRW
jgi:hypothetical protein